MRSKRLFAAYVDFVISVVLSTIITAIITCGKLDITPLSIVSYFASFIVFMTAKDIVFKNASIGKRFFKLSVVKTDGTRLTLLDAIKRAIPLFLLPIEIILMIINDRRLGDVWAGTTIRNK